MGVVATLAGALAPGLVAALVALAVGLAYEVGRSRVIRAGTAQGPRLGRPWLFRVALGVWVLDMIWPIGTYARTYVFMEAVQASILAFVLPALMVNSGPWAAFGAHPLVAKLVAKDPARVKEQEEQRAAARLAEVKAHRGQYMPGERRKAGRNKLWLRVMAFVVVFALWRIPIAVDGVRAVPGLLFVEAVTLLAVGIGLWLELAGSGSHTPKSERPQRIAFAAVTMWTTWIGAYALGFSHSPWYRAYLSAPGRIMSGVADQELSVFALFVISLASLGPIVFLNLTRWLRSEDDIDEALYVALREEADKMGGT